MVEPRVTEYGCDEPDCRAPEHAPVALTQLRTGEWGCVCDTSQCGEDAAMLRAMGLKPNAQVRVCRGGASCIVEVRWCDGPACRLGLSRRIAQRVMVGRS